MARASRLLVWIAIIALIWFFYKSHCRKSEKFSKYAARTWNAEKNAWACAAGYKDTGRNWGDGKPHDWRHCVINENTKFTTNLRYDPKQNKWIVGDCPYGYRPNGDQQGPSRSGDRACVRNDDDGEVSDERAPRTRPSADDEVVLDD
jgi:hypothetical protein